MHCKHAVNVRKKLPHLNCLENQYKYEWRLLGIMKKINEGKYRVTHFACDNKTAKLNFC